MRIAFYTPFYKNSDFMAHMVEHCAIHPRWDNPLYNMYVSWIEGHLRSEISYFDFESEMKFDDIKNMLFAPISQDIISYEKAIFQEEFGSVDYTSRVFEKLSQELINENRTTSIQEYSLKEVNEYHTKYYSEGKYIIYDENKEGDNIMYMNFDVSIAEHTTFSPLKFLQLYLQGEKNFFIVQDSKGVYDIYFFAFLCDVIQGRDSYFNRYCIKSYYTHGPSRNSAKNYNALRISPHTDLNIDKKFYIQQKNYFLRCLHRNYFKNDYVAAILYHEQKIDFDVLAKMVEEISYEYFMEEIVGKLKKL